MLTGVAPVNKPGLRAEALNRPSRFPAGTRTDSLAVVVEFVRNAKPLLDSLTALSFARIRIGKLQTQLSTSNAQLDLTAGRFITAQQQMGTLAQELTQSRLELGQLRHKYRWAKVEVWLWRIGGAYLLYKKVCPSCRP